MWSEGSTQILGIFSSELDLEVLLDSELEIIKEENLLDEFNNKPFNSFDHLRYKNSQHKLFHYYH